MLLWPESLPWSGVEEGLDNPEGVIREKFFSEEMLDEKESLMGTQAPKKKSEIKVKIGVRHE